MREIEQLSFDGRVWDAVVVGGGVAGISAALTLARLRRSVLVIDAGESPAAPDSDAFNMHGLLGRRTTSYTKLLRMGREQASRHKVPPLEAE
ncbi:FAD-dependent oxidoreductase [Streptomyces sp. PTY087I2]|uniref:FAD-dependent oxidoreductase n=1 Tax=Streptomyces sp. PTY087I2 TaxID=1819298 RepID=UPI00080B6F68|nr:FAD-dependent oxidoreductase [Streptomyces sp. PTY087I2]